MKAVMPVVAKAWYPPLPEFMLGFREKYQTADALQALRQTQERSNEWGLGFFMAAVDVPSAYDSVEWRHLWGALRE
eukprot:8931349-Prorocentrum_lima.AAC.1